MYSPGLGGDLWVFGLALAGFGTILGAVNFITTIVTMRAPGMTMFRMPIFTWNILVTSLLVLMAFPPLAAALFALGADRRLGAQVFNPENGGAILWQHLFWFFGHPEVYIIALPFFGIVTEILPVFSRKPIFGYKGLVYATIAIAALSVTVWAHHMYVTGSVLLPFFSFMTMLIAVPTGVKFFNWIGTMWRGKLTFETPMLWTIGFLVTFLFGGLTGIILSSPALDFQLSDSYFVVAHFHYVVFGTVVFAMFAGFYFWWPKMTGRMLDERLGKIHFWLLFIGFHTTFLIQHWLGVKGMPRRYADYSPDDGFTWMNQLSTVGAVHPRRLDAAVPLERLHDVAQRAAGARSTTRGATAPRSSGPPAARRRGTTSRRCPGSARSAPRSTCTTPRSPRWTTSSPNPGSARLGGRPPRRDRASRTDRVVERHRRARAVHGDDRRGPPADTRRGGRRDEARDQALPLRGAVLRPRRPDLRARGATASPSARSASRSSAAWSA